MSIRKFTWFDNSKMSIQKSLFVAYCFIYKMPIKDAIRETSLHFLHNESIDNDVGDSIHIRQEELPLSFRVRDRVRTLCLQEVGVTGRSSYF